MIRDLPTQTSKEKDGERLLAVRAHGPHFSFDDLPQYHIFLYTVIHGFYFPPPACPALLRAADMRRWWAI